MAFLYRNAVRTSHSGERDCQREKKKQQIFFSHSTILFNFMSCTHPQQRNAKCVMMTLLAPLPDYIVHHSSVGITASPPSPIVYEFGFSLAIHMFWCHQQQHAHTHTFCFFFRFTSHDLGNLLRQFYYWLSSWERANWSRSVCTLATRIRHTRWYFSQSTKAKMKICAIFFSFLSIFGC